MSPGGPPIWDEAKGWTLALAKALAKRHRDRKLPAD